MMMMNTNNDDDDIENGCGSSTNSFSNSKEEKSESSGYNSDIDGGGSKTSGTSGSTSTKSVDAIKNEESAVRKTRIMVCLTIILCAIGICVAVYFLSKGSDQRSFELEYEGFTTDVMSLVRWEVRYNFALMEQLSSQITIAAGLMNTTFPFHTEPQYEITGGFVDGMGGIMTAAFAPLVTVDQRSKWEKYSQENQNWIQDSAHLKAVHSTHRDALHGTIQDHEHDRRLSRRQLQQGDDIPDKIYPKIYKFEDPTELGGKRIPEKNEPGKLFAPLWQVSPADSFPVNMNLLSDPRIAKIYESMLKMDGTVLSQSTPIGDLFDFLFDPVEKVFKKDPHGLLIAPVYSKIEEKVNSTLVGIIVAVTPFGNTLDRLLPKGRDGIIGVFNDDCGDVMSFELSDGKATFLGYEDVHDPSMEEYERVEYNLEKYGAFDGFYGQTYEGQCSHNLYLYPTQKMQDTYSTSKTGTYLTIVGIALALVAIFILYDRRVANRQLKTMRKAIRARAIVSSLFPERIAQKMVDEPGGGETSKTTITSRLKGPNGKKFESFMEDQKTTAEGATNLASKPLADLFPEATVMFGDLVGFTAWSSLREPHHVFTLLETIYNSFDQLANKTGVFKVETIGDCYVAVCGLPKPRKDHATVMARFAYECCRNLPTVLRKLEVELGPDTSSLGIRVGLHSGPVTAGVLRGERARFQLFGDTVNTTARIESTGQTNKVHMSEETANRLIAAGKDGWVIPREDKVSAKGKGELNTFWLKLKSDSEGTPDTSAKSSEGSEDIETESRRQVKLETGLDEERERFVTWVVDVMKRPLNELVSRRMAMGTKADSSFHLMQAELDLSNDEGRMVIEEVQEVIMLPKYNAKNLNPRGCKSSEITPEVASQLHEYVRAIALLYNSNPFHNFEHACHVFMSCSKLLSRIVSPQIEVDVTNDHKVLHDHTYGITSDPLTQFSVMLSALIHDLDHPGVPNTTLNEELDDLACLYCHKSAAEQHSYNTGWELLMEDSYKDLRRAIYCNKEELVRFRKLTVNAVMATDIMDKELGAARKARWNKVFADDTTIEGSNPLLEEEDTNRKATIVIEHIIQASDVAHTMQHWHIFRKWNERLFRENYLAYKAGRAEKNPVDGWYKGEIGFFDFYIIPLAKKLESCGVFGVSSDEYLSYALQNRKEWVAKGEQVVKEFEEIVEKEYSEL